MPLPGIAHSISERRCPRPRDTCLRGADFQWSRNSCSDPTEHSPISPTPEKHVVLSILLQGTTRIQWPRRKSTIANPEVKIPLSCLASAALQHYRGPSGSGLMSPPRAGGVSPRRHYSTCVRARDPALAGKSTCRLDPPDNL